MIETRQQQHNNKERRARTTSGRDEGEREAKRKWIWRGLVETGKREGGWKQKSIAGVRDGEEMEKRKGEKKEQWTAVGGRGK